MNAELREAVEASRSPRVDALIEKVMQEHPGFGVSTQARYYEAVHQELAPLARDSEALLRDVLAASAALKVSGDNRAHFESGQDTDRFRKVIARITAHLGGENNG
jgi:hypothetical protein